MKYIIAFGLICCSLVIMAQEQKYPQVIVTDTTWSKEIFPFPIHFAEEIKYEGYEDAQFTKGWAKPESDEFWSYLFAWNIEHSGEFSENELETNLQFYFDGLMNVVNKDKSFEVPSTNVLFLKEGKQEYLSDFVGKVKLYDAFHTKAMLTLNVLVHIEYCEAEDKSIIVFRFSPKDFDSNVWEKLIGAELHTNACEL